MSNLDHVCFNCQRSEREIPMIAWQYQGQALWVCSECTPLIIHKWRQVAAKMLPPKE
ncbi:hypothetical protein [Candidatus Leptofilum sp.]|uniref:hypothetical protein n=1 Tax=Candidatus Leptofilum sp. TaxID=3241576 RepID=UPI003B58C55C